jgi:hypothetical protein
VTDEQIPGVSDDPVSSLILTGRATTLDEAEEFYLDESLPELLELLRQPIADNDLAAHPLLVLLRVRGRRGLDDSVL